MAILLSSMNLRYADMQICGTTGHFFIRAS